MVSEAAPKIFAIDNIDAVAQKYSSFNCFIQELNVSILLSA